MSVISCDSASGSPSQRAAQLRFISAAIMASFPSTLTFGSDSPSLAFSELRRQDAFFSSVSVPCPKLPPRRKRSFPGNSLYFPLRGPDLSAARRQSLRNTLQIPYALFFLRKESRYYFSSSSRLLLPAPACRRSWRRKGFSSRKRSVNSAICNRSFWRSSGNSRNQDPVSSPVHRSPPPFSDIVSSEPRKFLSSPLSCC